MDARTRGFGTLLLAVSLVFTMGCAAHRYDANGNHYYEGYDHRHATEGAILGGLAGAGVGRAIAGHHNDEAGYWIGGALGALTGAVIGDVMDRDEAVQRAPYDYGHPGDRPPPPHRDDHDRYEDDAYDEDDDEEYEDRWDDYSSRPPPLPNPQLLSLPNEVLFATSSDRLEAGAKRRLRAVAKAMRDHPGTVAVIRGHASRQESSQSALSDARARSVRDHLLRHGIAPSRVTALGLGGRFPLASDRTAEGQQRNRRAEIEIQTEVRTESRRDREHELAGLW